MAEKPLIQQFQDDLNAVVDKYRNQRLTIAAAVGVLEIIKMDVADEMAAEDEF